MRKRIHVLIGLLMFAVILVASLLFGRWAEGTRVAEQRAATQRVLVHVREHALRSFANIAALQHGIANVISEQDGEVSAPAFSRLMEDFLGRNSDVAAEALVDRDGIHFSHGVNAAALDWLHHGAPFQDPRALVDHHASLSLITSQGRDNGEFFLALVQSLAPSRLQDKVAPERRSLVFVVNVAALFARLANEIAPFNAVFVVIDADGKVVLGSLSVQDNDPELLPLEASWPGPDELRLLPADWVLAAVPRNGWGFSLLERVGVYAVICMSAAVAFSAVILALYFSWVRGRSNDRLRDSTSALSSRDRRLAYLADHDEATGLKNYAYLEQWRNGQVGDRGPFTLFLIDIHHFKNVNLTYGPDTGDRVLATIGARLRDVLDEDAIAVRIGGDKFLVIFSGAIVEGALPPGLQAVVTAVEQPVAAGEHLIRLGTIIGIAVAADGDENRTEMLGRADIALARGAMTGRGSICFFDEAMRMESARIRQIADEIVAAIETDQIDVFFQPQVSARGYRVSGAEALVRWRHPERGILAPAVFMPSVELMNLTARIDAIVLQKALAYLRGFEQSGLFLPRLSVNVSGPRLSSPGLFEDLEMLDLPAGRLGFEVLESVYLDEGNAVMARNLAAARAHGIDIEVDDFGTGFASIISLLRLRPSRLKIDRELIAPIVDDEVQRQVIAAIVDIARARKVGLVAEGVETLRHAEILRDIGIETFQGFAFSKPLPAEEFARYLAVHGTGPVFGP
ncbi:bifunctional diguanylate cyclase/phosphodiesterase [Martelella sp. HB161492]|uniref:putative bifunctional diguanylate cyclase/phosphodiesterase n=1 Tax=Martelella sp. HB161492 TaxID=2720726 RepID=UPI001591BC8B|nr:bifunctional diguanylate cyclase/phosphodiesterase [Martelella sp. HB161492]